VEGPDSPVRKAIEELLGPASHDEDVAKAMIVDLLEGFFAPPPFDFDADEQLLSLLPAIFD
jgi:hypothetical protein